MMYGVGWNVPSDDATGLTQTGCVAGITPCTRGNRGTVLGDRDPHGKNHEGH